jgi:hypothetical protein
VVLADIVNAGAVYVPSSENIIVDGDVVTGRSGQDVYAFIEAIAQQMIRCAQGVSLFDEPSLSPVQSTQLQSLRT